jgi:hypothetical protein
MDLCGAAGVDGAAAQLVELLLHLPQLVLGQRLVAREPLQLLGDLRQSSMAAMHVGPGSRALGCLTTV